MTTKKQRNDAFLQGFGYAFERRGIPKKAAPWDAEIEEFMQDNPQLVYSALGALLGGGTGYALSDKKKKLKGTLGGGVAGGLAGFLGGTGLELLGQTKADKEHAHKLLRHIHGLYDDDKGGGGFKSDLINNITGKVGPGRLVTGFEETID